MKKLNGVTIVLVILGLLFSLMVGCGGESPERLFETAQFEEKQTNITHARELYQRIMDEHPESEWAKKAKTRLEQLDRPSTRGTLGGSVANNSKIDQGLGSK